MNYKTIIVLAGFSLILLLSFIWRKEIIPTKSNIGNFDIFGIISALASIATVFTLFLLIVQINDSRKANLYSTKPFLLLPSRFEFQVNRDSTVSFMTDNVIKFSGRNYFLSPFCITNVGNSPAIDIEINFDYDIDMLNQKLLENYKSGGSLTNINGEYIKDHGTHKISLGYIKSSECDFNGSFLPMHIYPYILETMFEKLPEIYIKMKYKDLHGNKYNLKYRLYRSSRPTIITLDEKAKNTILLYFGAPIETIELVE